MDIDKTKFKIDWLANPDGTPGKSHNIVFGCKGKCPYCYGRAMAKRFKMAEKMARCEMKYKYGDNWMSKIIDEYKSMAIDFKYFIPTFRPSVLAQKLRKKPTMYFFSMSDPVYWEQEWYEKIIEKITKYMQHTFIILTKQPKIYRKYSFPHNCWLGVTCTTQLMLNQFECDLSNWFEPVNKVFISIEPIQEKIKISGFLKYVIDWVIVGPETGISKNKTIPEKEWINCFYDIDVPVFMKSSCSKIIDTSLRQEWPANYMEKT